MGTANSSIDNLKLEIDKNFMALIDDISALHVPNAESVKMSCIKNIQASQKVFNSGKNLEKINTEFIPTVINKLNGIYHSMFEHPCPSRDNCVKSAHKLSKFVNQYIAAHDT